MAQRCRDPPVALPTLVLVVDGTNLGFHVALLLGAQDRLALVVERAACKACCL